MSESGLAVLCGVSQQSVNKLLRILVTINGEINALKARLDQKVWSQPRGLSSLERGNIKNFVIVRAKACAAVVEHYAFESRYRTEDATFTDRTSVTSLTPVRIANQRKIASNIHKAPTVL